MSENAQKPNILMLRATEASQRDFGRGLARIDPEDMKKANAETGDVILITGKKRTAAKVLPGKSVV